MKRRRKEIGDEVEDRELENPTRIVMRRPLMLAIRSLFQLGVCRPSLRT
jgi:hypothetical protein